MDKVRPEIKQQSKATTGKNPGVHRHPGYQQQWVTMFGCHKVSKGLREAGSKCHQEALTLNPKCYKSVRHSLALPAKAEPTLQGLIDKEKLENKFWGLVTFAVYTK